MSILEEQLKKIEEVVKTMDGVLTKEEFIQSFENVVKLVMEVRAKNEREFNVLRQNFQQMAESLNNDTTSTLEELKNKVSILADTELTKLKSQYEDKINEVDKRLKTIRDGNPGTPGKKGDKGEPGKDGSPDSGEDIVNKINELPTGRGAPKIDAKHIKNLPKGQSDMTGGGNMTGGRNISVSGAIIGLDITVSSTPPDNPELNQLWIETP